MKIDKNISSNESGNVIFIILIAVALFAALSMAISTTSRYDGSGNKINKEEERIKASEMLEYVNNLTTNISRLRLNGCSAEQISFENDTVSGYDNPLSPSDETCHVFSSAGGGMTYKAYDSIYTGSYVISNVGTSQTDLILDIRTSKTRCEEINTLLGIPNDGAEGPPTDKLSAGVKFQGDFTIAATAASNQRTDASNLVGEKAGCRTNSGSGDSAIFYFYGVLLAR